MDTNKMREQFEAKFGRPHGVYWHPPFSRYMTTSNHVACVEHQGRWEGWQASRQAVVVELPESSGISGDGIGAIAVCRRAIEAQGLKVEVKP